MVTKTFTFCDQKFPDTLAPRRFRNKVIKTESYPKGCSGICCVGLDLDAEGSQEKGKILGGAVSDMKLVLSHSHPFLPYVHVFILKCRRDIRTILQ